MRDICVVAHLFPYLDAGNKVLVGLVISTILQFGLCTLVYWYQLVPVKQGGFKWLLRVDFDL
jgi:hypothetical protein